uniref:Uncharacterized protein n=1 Tax=Coccolithus braarudii TaxID=221442 RepID=A0A6T7E1G9_9EUKA|mmetsp:Transcript_19366/g.41658  ORF Transcript_19366/g.41658 Transcript_19366/m.41658 type:complete len:187 (+) Transcript_19366:1061-1621(+)|eukprot:CAMPEP_0183350314 /NCGR_PEP_ID=MMETSP0164_2-20130417/18426_1 /TAXON_ID=221442 /ORGANISM="Coccolithus pelagicus ssp braarudi, Strain PLY182g" /LENGTH=186 /DNA_ID=CAMNT_0025522213 /DNA_START=201 /DNA_END=761 /DNA_ORIENTATION=+
METTEAGGEDEMGAQQRLEFERLFMRAIQPQLDQSPMMTTERSAFIVDLLRIWQSLSGPEKKALAGANGYRWIRQYVVKNMGDDTYELVYTSKSGGLPDGNVNDPILGAIASTSQTQFVCHLGRLFNDLLHLHVGTGHSKAVILHKAAQAKFGVSIPRWACTIFGKLCPGCNMATPRRFEVRGISA